MALDPQLPNPVRVPCRSGPRGASGPRKASVVGRRAPGKIQGARPRWRVPKLLSFPFYDNMSKVERPAIRRFADEQSRCVDERSIR